MKNSETTCRLILTHDCTVNILAGQSQIYRPSAKAYDILARGTLEHCQTWQHLYFSNGYGTKIIID